MRPKWNEANNLAHCVAPPFYDGPVAWALDNAHDYAERAVAVFDTR